MKASRASPVLPAAFLLHSPVFACGAVVGALAGAIIGASLCALAKAEVQAAIARAAERPGNRVISVSPEGERRA